MHPGESKAGAVVIELGVRPIAGLMALSASLREVRRNVVRIGGALKILQVARHAGGIA